MTIIRVIQGYLDFRVCSVSLFGISRTTTNYELGQAIYEQLHRAHVLVGNFGCLSEVEIMFMEISNT